MAIPVDEFVQAFERGFDRPPTMPRGYSTLERARFDEFFGRGAMGMPKFGRVAYEIYQLMITKLAQISRLPGRPPGSFWSSYAEFYMDMQNELAQPHQRGETTTVEPSLFADIQTVQSGRATDAQVRRVTLFVQTVLRQFVIHGWRWPTSVLTSAEATDYNTFTRLIGAPLELEYRALPSAGR